MEDLGIDQKFLKPTQLRPLASVAGSYTYFADGDVLLAKITPCFENGKLGIASGLHNAVAFGSSEFIVLRPSPTLDKEFLYYYLSRSDFRSAGATHMGGAVGQQRIPRDFVENYTTPVPPMAEQQRIVGILDKAFAAIVTARGGAEKSLQDTRAFVRSTFIEALGSLDHSGWRACTVGEAASEEAGSIRTGPFGSQLLHSEFVTQGIPVLGIDNAVLNRFAWSERRYITPQKFEVLSRYLVTPGDVLITIMGTCGRCAVVPDDIPTAINSKHLCCITLNKKKCLPEFLHAYFLYHPTAREFLSRRAKGAIMAGLNMGIIKELPLLLPPVEQQRRVIMKISRVRQFVEQLESIYQQKIAVLDELKESLLHQAFTGAL
jgi:type I restriction enzyme, S subunit